MNIRQHSKFLSIVSLTSLISILGIFYLTKNTLLVLFISVLADSIQIVTYIVWLFKREVPLEETPKQVKVVYEYVKEKKETEKVKEELITKLVNEGAIRESELYSLIRNKEIILAFTYGEGVPSKIRKLIGLKRQPLLALFERMGFVRVTGWQNLLVSFTDNLPRSLRRVDNLNKFIKKELPRCWARISDEVKNSTLQNSIGYMKNGDLVKDLVSPTSSQRRWLKSSLSIILTMNPSLPSSKNMSGERSIGRN